MPVKKTHRNQKPEVSITIPIYNEEAGITTTITNLLREFDKHKVDYELVLINHGSWDNTEKVINELAKKNKRINAINLPKNLGYGGGIMYGFEHSKGEYIGWTCADEEVSAEDVYRIIDILRKNKNIYDVSKSRRMDRKDGNFRKLTSFVFNSLVAIRFNLHIKDVNGYPVFFKRELYQRVKPREKEHLFNLDLMRKIRKNKLRIIEVTIIHRKRKVSRSFMKLSRISEMAFDLIKYSI